MNVATKPLSTNELGWVPLRPGLSMRPLHFQDDGYALQLKVEPGTVIARHRHSGEVHALNLSGYREIIETGEIVGPGDYVYEPPGNVDSWRCHGDEPCIIHIALTGRLDYLDDQGNSMHHTDTTTALDLYLAHCASLGAPPDSRIVGNVAA